MHAVIRYYRFDPAYSEQVDLKVHAFSTELVRDIQGFVAYYWIDAGRGEGASVSVYEDRAGAQESVRRADEFMRRELPFVGTPEVLEGEVRAHSQGRMLE